MSHMKCEMDFVLINELFEIFAACIVSVVVIGSEALLLSFYLFIFIQPFCKVCFVRNSIE